MNKIVRDYKNGDIDSQDNIVVYENIDRANSLDMTNAHVHELGWSGNFRGFVQYRKTMPNENITA